jgi:hypothetical protein
MPANLLAIAFQPAHAASLSLRPGAVQALAGMPPLGELARAYHAAGPAWTVLDGDAVMACGGVVRFWPGVGECWCWAGAGVDLAPVAFARLALRVVESLGREHGFHRLQVHAHADDVRANRFATHLGFTLEGRCPGFGPTQSGQATYNLYGRYRTWKE